MMRLPDQTTNRAVKEAAPTALIVAALAAAGLATTEHRLCMTAAVHRLDADAAYCAAGLATVTHAATERPVIDLTNKPDLRYFDRDT